MTQPDGAATQLETLRGLVNAATQRLLGDTIAVSDEDWRAPSRLPGWSRGHVATHIARQADGIVRLTEWARTGERQDMYASAEQREADIDAGLGPDRAGAADRPGHLRRPAGPGLRRPGRGQAWDAVVELRGGTKVPGPAAAAGPAARGRGPPRRPGHRLTSSTRIENATAEWLLEWCAFRVRSREEFPKLDLTSDSGFTISLGNAGEPTAVSGTSANLLGWVMSRVDDSAVSGGEGLQRPPF